MTVPAFAKELGGRLPSVNEQEAANQLRKVLAIQTAGKANLHVLGEDRKPVKITLTPALSGLLMEMLRHVGRGDAVTLVPFEQMLTTQQAADILNVSRPFLISLLEKGEIDHSTVGKHRRIKAEHVFAYKAAKAEKRSKALEELAELDAEHL